MLKLDTQIAVLIALAGLVAALTGLIFLIVGDMTPGLVLVIMGALGMGVAATATTDA